MESKLYNIPIPYFIKKSSNTKISQNFKNFIVLGLGANKPKGKHDRFDPSNRIYKCIYKLAQNRKIKILQISNILKNPPFGYANQPDFYNCVVEIQTNLNIVEIYGLIFYIERCFGRERKREFKNAPRYLDIDIIFYNNLILRRTYLEIPHVAWKERLSVCIPLSQLKI